jgi:hypothetical protein
MPLSNNVNTVESVMTPQNSEETADNQAKPSKKRLNLDLAFAAYELLQKLSRDTDKNMADVLRTGLALYGIAYEARTRGQGIGIIEKDKVVKEIIIT